MPRPCLSSASLTARSLSCEAARPAYDRAALRPAILHLGLGAFFRAHGALFTEDVLNRQGGDWGIFGVSLQRPEQRDRLAPQDGLYTALERGPGASGRASSASCWACWWRQRIRPRCSTGGRPACRSRPMPWPSPPGRAIWTASTRPARRSRCVTRWRPRCAPGSMPPATTRPTASRRC